MSEKFEATKEGVPSKDCCDSLLIVGSDRTYNKDMGFKGNTFKGWRQ